MQTPLEISHINVTVRKVASADRVRQAVLSLQSILPPSHPSPPKVTVGLQDQNGQATQEADVVILGCKSYAFKDILSDQEVRTGLLGNGRRKTLVSILGGVTIAQLQSCLFDSNAQEPTNKQHRPAVVESGWLCTIVRAVPNIAARNRESITIISSSDPSISPQDDNDRQVNRLFALLGPTRTLLESQINHASALAASSLAFYANIIVGAADGALDRGNGQGLSKEDAMWISAQAVRGASGLVVAGQDPSRVVADVATKGGSTAAGLKVMEERGVAKAVSAAVKECARATEMLSKASAG